VLVLKEQIGRTREIEKVSGRELESWSNRGRGEPGSLEEKADELVESERKTGQGRRMIIFDMVNPKQK
jgi:hypothetical protein